MPKYVVSMGQWNENFNSIYDFFPFHPKKYHNVKLNSKKFCVFKHNLMIWTNLIIIIQLELPLSKCERARFTKKAILHEIKWQYRMIFVPNNGYGKNWKKIEKSYMKYCKFHEISHDRERIHSCKSTEMSIANTTQISLLIEILLPSSDTNDIDAGCVFQAKQKTIPAVNLRLAKLQSTFLHVSL